MNTKEIGEIRRHIRRDRSNMTAIYGCYVNENREIISQFRQSTGLMTENESERYFGLLRRALSGSLGKNLIDVRFSTAQVAGSPEHGLLMALRQGGETAEGALEEFYQKVIESVNLESNYLILLGCDRYDVPFKGKDGISNADGSEEVYAFALCAICPVKQTKAALRYIPEEQTFHDGGITNVVSAPELGFLFPAFDDRATNLYNALYYTRSPKESHEAFAEALFHAPIPRPAAEQKQSFEGVLGTALGEDCSLDVVQTVDEDLCQRIAMHKESRVPDPLLIDKETVRGVLEQCGVSEEKQAKFSVDFDEAFGFEAELHPKNLIDEKHFEIKTPDVSIKVSPERANLIETRVLGGVPYVLIQADESVEVNGVPIHIGEKEPAEV